MATIMKNKMNTMFSSPMRVKRKLATGASIKPLASDTGVIQGASHAQGGVDMGNVEVEGKEVMKQNPDGTANVYSDQLGFADAVKPLAIEKGKLENMLKIYTDQANKIASKTSLDTPSRNTTSRRLKSISLRTIPLQQGIATLDNKMEQLFAAQQQVNGGQAVDGEGNATQGEMATGGKTKIAKFLEPTPAFAESTATRNINTFSKPIVNEWEKTPTPKTNLDSLRKIDISNYGLRNYTAPIKGYTPEPKASNLMEDMKKKYPQSGAIQPDYTLEKIAASAVLPSFAGAMGVSNRLASEAIDLAVEGIGIPSGFKSEAAHMIGGKYLRNKIASTMEESAMEKDTPDMKVGGKVKLYNGASLDPRDNQFVKIKNKLDANLINDNAKELGFSNMGNSVKASDITGNMETSDSSPLTPRTPLNLKKVGNAMDSLMPFVDNATNLILTSATPNAPSPILTKASKFETKLDTNSSVNEVNNSIDGANKMAMNYGSGSPVAVAGSNAVRRIDSMNKINENRNNTEAQMRNAQTAENTNNNKENAKKIEDYLGINTQIQAGKLNDYGKNVANLEQNVIENTKFKAKQASEKKWLDIEGMKYGNNAFLRNIAPIVNDYNNVDDYLSAMEADYKKEGKTLTPEYRAKLTEKFNSFK